MSTISGVGGGPWAGRTMPDMSAMRQRMFAKVDSDGSGGVDATELQQVIDKVSERSGKDLGNASDLMTKWDSDGNGTLSSDEFDAGMKSLMPAPSSTVEFAQMHGEHARPNLFAKVDSDGNGSVDATELQQVIDKVSERSGKDLGSASDLMTKWDSDGNGTLSSDELEAGMKTTFQSDSASGHGPHMDGDGSKGMHVGGTPPPGAGGSCGDASSSSSSSGSSDPADTNGDGVVSAGERAAAELKKLVEALSGGTGAASGSTSVAADPVSNLLTRLQQAIDTTA